MSGSSVFEFLNEAMSDSIRALGPLVLESLSAAAKAASAEVGCRNELPISSCSAENARAAMHKVSVALISRSELFIGVCSLDLLSGCGLLRFLRIGIGGDEFGER